MSTDVEAAIAAGLLNALRSDSVQSVYLGHHLASHVGAADSWSELDQWVLDRIDPGTVAAEAFRTAYGRRSIPAPVLVTMVAANDLATAAPSQRGLVRALAAHRLRISDPALTVDPALRWCRLQPVTPHITLTGHTSWVTAVAFGQLSDGRTLLATGSHDATVRLWDPATSNPTSYLLAPSIPNSVIVSADAIFIGCSDGVLAVSAPLLSRKRTGDRDN